MNQPRKDLLPPAAMFTRPKHLDPVEALLKDQAALMEERTGGVIRPRVSTTFEGDRLRLRFTLVVPRLDNYSHQLFWIHKGVDDFPLVVGDGESEQHVASMESLEDRLRELFGRKETVEVIQRLLALADEVEADERDEVAELG